MAEKTLFKKFVYENRIFRVREDEVVLPNGKTTDRFFIEHNGGACILIVNKEKNTAYFVRQFRYALNETLLELPAGKIDNLENHYNTAIREAQEEVGVLPIDLHYLGFFYPTCGYSNEKIYLYYTEHYQFNKLSLDDDEFLDVEEIDLDLAYKMINDGTITDGKTIIALLRYKELTNGSTNKI